MSQCESVASTVSAQEDEDIEASNEEENPEDSEGILKSYISLLLLLAQMCNF